MRDTTDENMINTGTKHQFFFLKTDNFLKFTYRIMIFELTVPFLWIGIKLSRLGSRLWKIEEIFGCRFFIIYFFFYLLIYFFFLLIRLWARSAHPPPSFKKRCYMYVSETSRHTIILYKSTGIDVCCHIMRYHWNMH